METLNSIRYILSYSFGYKELDSASSKSHRDVSLNSRTADCRQKGLPAGYSIQEKLRLRREPQQLAQAGRPECRGQFPPALLGAQHPEPLWQRVLWADKPPQLWKGFCSTRACGLCEACLHFSEAEIMQTVGQPGKCLHSYSVLRLPFPSPPLPLPPLWPWGCILHPLNDLVYSMCRNIVI